MAAPLPFGGAPPFVASLLAAFALGLGSFLLLWSRRSLPSSLAFASGPLFALALLGLVQASFPKPPARIEPISPAAANPGEESSFWRPGSVAPGASRSAAADWAGAGAILLAGGVVGGSRRGRRVLALAGIFAAIVQVALGWTSILSGAHSLWGQELPHFGLRLRGTFVNPNHLALFLGLAWGLSLALLAHRLRRRASPHPRPADSPWLLATSVVAPPFFLAALLATQSRGAIVAIAAVAGTWLLLYGGEIGRRARLALSIGTAVVALTVFLSAGSTPLERFFGPRSEGLSTGGRGEALRVGLDIWRSSPIWGAGLGSFEVAFSRFQPADLGGRWRHAHNDTIELLATTGVVGLALLAAGGVFTFRKLLRGFRRARGLEERDACAAALLASVYALVHGLFDFGLTLPANAWFLAALLGAALGAADWEPPPEPRSGPARRFDQPA